MLWGFKRFQHEVVGFCGSIIWKSCWDNAPTHTHAQRLSSWECGLSLFLPGKGLLENLRDRQGRQKVETSSDLTAINSLVICSCLPTLTTLVLGAVWSMGHGPQPLWSEVDPSDYTLGNCTFSLLLLSLSFLTLSSLTPLHSLFPFPHPLFHQMRFGGFKWRVVRVTISFICMFLFPLQYKFTYISIKHFSSSVVLTLPALDDQNSQKVEAELCEQTRYKMSMLSTK